MSGMQTFASDVKPWPRRRDDWDDCTRFVGELLEQRQQAYPGLIEQQKLTADQAERGLRVMGAIARLWNHIAARKDLPAPVDCEAALGASLEEMQAEIEGSRDRLRQIASRPEAGSDDRRKAELGDALWWHLQPVCDGAPPHIWLAHEFAQWERAQPKRGRAA